MNKDYVIINIETNGYFNKNDDTQIIYLEAIKVDVNLQTIASFKTYIKPVQPLTIDVEIKTGITNEMLMMAPSEKSVMLDLITFCDNSNIITHNAKFELSFILKSLYKNKIYIPFKFNYLDIKDLVSDKKGYMEKYTWNNIKEYFGLTNLSALDCIIKILKKYLNEDIKDLKELFYIQPFHGKVFRGLTYAKYLCDILTSENKYHGYIIDSSEDKYIAFHAFLKELNQEYFSLEEIYLLRNKGAKVILNISYLYEESISFADCYSLQVTDTSGITDNCEGIIRGINNFVNLRKQDNLKLVLWGNKENLKCNSEVISPKTFEEFINSINIIKSPWEEWTSNDFNVINKNISRC